MPAHSDWYKTWFDETYLRLYSHRSLAEARRFARWLTEYTAGRPIAPLADIACGAGRHGWVFAEEFSIQPVVGVDLSMSLLKRAQAQRRAEDGAEVHFLQGDMRRLPLLDAKFQSALCMFTSFGYFSSEAEHHMALAEMARILSPGGLLVLDLLNPEPTLKHLVAQDEKQMDGLRVRQQRRYLQEEKRIEKRITLREGSETREVLESVRIFTLEEATALLDKAGMDLMYRAGDYSGEAYEEAASPRMLLIARKRS